MAVQFLTGKVENRLKPNLLTLKPKNSTDQQTDRQQIWFTGTL